jgi:pimeloyl-ACP methyl ester carboxylesterase
VSPREEGRLRAHDGVELAYRLVDDGPGRPLVLLHGGGANLEAMDQFRERLGAGRRTVAFDARACGQSGDPTSFSWQDAARDVDTVVTGLGLGDVDVVGHSMGGFVGGFYATDHPGARLVSIDGFGPGVPTLGNVAERAAFREFQTGMRAAFWDMTEAPEEGDRAWRDAQVAELIQRYPGMGYTAPNAPAVAARNLVDLGDGLFRRHPSRLLFQGGFADGGDRDVLRMYRGLRSPALLVRCTLSGAPPVLDLELDALAATNPCVDVVRLPVPHLAPAWEALDTVVAMIEPFLAQRADL